MNQLVADDLLFYFLTSGSRAKGSLICATVKFYTRATSMLVSWKALLQTGPKLMSWVCVRRVDFLTNSPGNQACIVAASRQSAAFILASPRRRQRGPLKQKKDTKPDALQGAFRQVDKSIHFQPALNDHGHPAAGTASPSGQHCEVQGRRPNVIPDNCNGRAIQNVVARSMKRATRWQHFVCLEVFPGVGRIVTPGAAVVPPLNSPTSQTATLMTQRRSVL